MIDNKVNTMYEEILGSVHINDMHEDTTEEGTLLDVCPHKLGSVLNKSDCKRSLCSI